MFINLFLLGSGIHGFNHIAPGKNFIKHPFAEDFIPRTGPAGSNTADNYILGSGRHSLSRSGLTHARSIRFNGTFGFFYCGSVAGYPTRKSGVVSGIVTKHIGTRPIQSDTGRNQVGEQVVKFHNAAFFGVIGSQHFDVFFIG